MTAVLQLRDVHRRYGSGASEASALRGVDLSVETGELVAVMGPSASGKSTLLNLAGGLDRPTSGRVLVNGYDITVMDAAAIATLRRKEIGIVFQELNLLPTLSAVENVMLPLELDGVGRRRAREMASEALSRVRLTGDIERFPDDLSGGEEQRVAIARAIAGQRSLLLADEPTGALDTMAGDQIADTQLRPDDRWVRR